MLKLRQKLPYLMLLLSGAIPASAQTLAYATNFGSASVSVIDTATNHVVSTVSVGSGPVGIAITPDGAQIYVANQNSGTVSVITSPGNAVTSTITVGGRPVAVAITPDGTRAYIANASSNSVSVVDTTSNTVLNTIKNLVEPRVIAITPDGSRAYIALTGANQVSVIDLVTNTIIASIPVGSGPLGISITPDGRRIYVMNGNSNNFSVIEASSNTVVATVRVTNGFGNGPELVALSPDGTRAYATVTNSASVLVIDTGSNTVLTTIPVGIGPQGIAITSDGTCIYVTNETSGTVSVINTGSNTVIASVPVGAAPFRIAVSQAGQIRITTKTLPSAVVGHPYDSGQLMAVGGGGTFSWSLASGSLPSSDYTLFPTGEITAPPSAQAAPGKYKFRLRATDLDTSEFAEIDFTLAVLSQVTILDPVPALLNGPQITAARTLLGSLGRPVTGIAADGIAQVVFRIPTLSAGDLVTVTLLNDHCSDPSNPMTCTPSDSSDDDGGLFAVGTAVTPNQPLSNMGQDSSDSSTPNAFVAYRTPIDFARAAVSSDLTLASRSVYFQINYSSGGVAYGSQIVPFTIVRAPVILVHGFNTDSSAWDAFVPLTTATSQFAIFTVNYGSMLYQPCPNPTATCLYQPVLTVNNVLLDIQRTDPVIALADLYLYARQSHLGFSFNAPYVGNIIAKIIIGFCLGNNPLNIPVAGVSGDIVAHSMGGLVARYWTALPTFVNRTNYNQGYIHKLITLGTPHFGTPQAILSVLPQTSCSRDLAATAKNLFFSSASLVSNVTVTGAAGELSGDGIGVKLSIPLQTIKSHALPVPMATLAGDVSSIEFKIDSSSVSEFTLSWCKSAGDPLAAKYSSLLFDNIFDPAITSSNPGGGAGGRKSDGSVPITSATMNPAITGSSLCPAGTCFPGYVHSSGIASFFALSDINYLQDSSGVVAQRVETLLNTSVRMSVFSENR